MSKANEILDKIKIERERQSNLFGSEFDIKNSPGDWISLASHYLAKDVRRSGIQPDAKAFEESLIKASAVIVAALECVEIMKSRNELKDSSDV